MYLLYLGSSSVSKVGAAYFKELTSLTEIYLYDNVLNDIPDGGAVCRLISHFQYDVFVSYAEEDFHWVQHHLVPELEDRRGLKLCLHQRDFIPGKHIVDNIADCVESSKKVMMVFSSDFAKSPWCQFELTLCLTHVMDHDDALVITCLHDIPSRDLTPAMMAVMKTTTYIEWSHESDATASFWGRIGIALNDILSAERPCA
nr:hypothetical protein BaRGS_029071 [Batillaria attramentaria]